MRLAMAIQSPVRQIVENAGTDGSIVVGKLTDKNNPNFGDDAQPGEYKDMVKAGILGKRNMPGWADAGDVGRLRHGEKGIPQMAHVRPR